MFYVMQQINELWELPKIIAQFESYEEAVEFMNEQPEEERLFVSETVYGD